MPDLALIGPHDTGGLFAEVKSPNDTLSDLQASWLRVIEEAGIPVLLIRVEETPS